MPEAKDKELLKEVKSIVYRLGWGSSRPRLDEIDKQKAKSYIEQISDLLVAERQRVIEEAVDKIKKLPAIEWIHGIDEYVDRQEVITSLTSE